MSNSKDFSGKIALVAGSTSGIGEELVLQFAKYGAQVIVTGRRQDRIDAVVEKCNKISPNNLKHFECDICARQYTTQNGLVYHMTKHQEQIPTICNICGKSLVNASVLKKHLRIHGAKKYSCEYCEKKVFTLSNAKVHERIHKAEKPYSCKYCEKTFKQAQTLTSHLSTHTGEKPYQCEHCEKWFRLPENLKTHLRVHTKEKPFKPVKCGKAFAQSSGLKHHSLIHTDEKSHKCGLCSESFRHKHHLQNQLLTGLTGLTCKS